MSKISEHDILVGGLRQAAQSLRTVADSLQAVTEVMVGNTTENCKTDYNPNNTRQKHTTSDVTLEQVRNVLANKSNDGKRQEVKELLFKYNAGNLSGVKPEDYPALIEEAKNL